jgi:hypothetical protein
MALLKGVVMATTLEVGLALGAGVEVGVAVAAIVAVLAGVAVWATVAMGVGVLPVVLVGVAVARVVGVGVALPFCTVTLMEALPSTVPVEEKPVAEIVCSPLGAVVEFQLKVAGGVEAK